jgi:hypothetical protein
MPESNSTTPTPADKPAAVLQPPTTAKQKPVDLLQLTRSIFEEDCLLAACQKVSCI